MSHDEAAPVPSDSAKTVRVQSGTLEDGLANGWRLLKDNPQAALRQAETLIRSARDPRVYRLAAAACRALGLLADAHGAELGAIQSSLAEPRLREASLALAQGQPDHARQLAQAVLAGEPDDLLARTIAAEAAIELWDLENAEELLTTVLGRAPTFLKAAMLLAACLTSQSRPRDAIAVLRDVVARKPNNAAALAEHARLLAEVGDLDEAIAVQERLVRVEPAAPRPRVDLAHFYSIAGRRDAAVEALRETLRSGDGRGGAWWSLANYFPDEVTESDEQAMKGALSRAKGGVDDGALRLALGLVADRRGDHENAFEHFQAGKRILLASQPYDPQPVSALVDQIIATIPDRLPPGGGGCTDASPIFIIGMPRSGSTMVERILGRHSAIEAAGELPILARLAEPARRRAGAASYADLLQRLTASDFARLGEAYVRASLDYRHSGKRRFVDKNNFNWLQVGLILRALPRAKVIDLRRKALDCCWANFKMLFAAGFPAANALDHVGLFYRDYVRLVDSLAQASPRRILRLRYEAVVDDIESSTRAMLDFLELPFEPGCLDFHLSTGPVATASSEQVRRPLNRKGIGAAEPYRQWLGPLLEALGPLADS